MALGDLIGAADVGAQTRRDDAAEEPADKVMTDRFHQRHADVPRLEQGPPVGGAKQQIDDLQPVDQGEVTDIERPQHRVEPRGPDAGHQVDQQRDGEHDLEGIQRAFLHRGAPGQTELMSGSV